MISIGQLIDNQYSKCLRKSWKIISIFFCFSQPPTKNVSKKIQTEKDKDLGKNASCEVNVGEKAAWVGARCGLRQRCRIMAGKAYSYANYGKMKKTARLRVITAKEGDV